MKLTDAQIRHLHYHINDKQIPYTEVRDEVLDHYQTALESSENVNLEEVYSSLDQIFTKAYCKEISESYLKNLQQDFPKYFKSNLLSMFEFRNIWIPSLLLVLTLLMMRWIDSPWLVLSFCNVFLHVGLMRENFYFSRISRIRNQHYQYRMIDEIPILAKQKACVSKGITTFYFVIIFLLFIPLIVLCLFHFFELEYSLIIFQAPFIYLSLLLLWMFFLLTIVRYRSFKSLGDPQLV